MLHNKIKRRRPSWPAEWEEPSRLPRATLQIKLGRALGKTPLNPIHIWVKHVLPKRKKFRCIIKKFYPILN